VSNCYFFFFFYSDTTTPRAFFPLSRFVHNARTQKNSLNGSVYSWDSRRGCGRHDSSEDFGKRKNSMKIRTDYIKTKPSTGASNETIRETQIIELNTKILI